MMTAMQKGDILEDAVRAIETAILSSSPTLRENTFKIENKKRIKAAGVRHEIDVYVEVDIGKGYKAVFIFECKNWTSSVGKNEIVVFSEKIDATQAQKGFFVAKSFSADAKAQALKDGRIELLVTTEHDATKTPVPFDFHHVIRERDSEVAEINFTNRNMKKTDGKVMVPITNACATLGGDPINLQKYVQDWVDQLAEGNLKTFPSMTLPDGTYEREAQDEREYESGEFVLNGGDIAAAKLQIKFSVQVVRAQILSHFEVATRGRTISFAPVKVGGGAVQIALVIRTEKDSCG